MLCAQESPGIFRTRVFSHRAFWHPGIFVPRYMALRMAALQAKAKMASHLPHSVRAWLSHVVEDRSDDAADNSALGGFSCRFSGHVFHDLVRQF